MKYAQLRTMDIANGPGIRVSLFVSGCTHHCKGCFNEEYQDFNYGQEMSMEVTETILSLLRQRQYKGLTLIGGEPFQNVELVDYIRPIRAFVDEYNAGLKDKEFDKKDIWIYSGYTFEEILEDPEKLALLELTDVLIDGLFEESLLNLKLKFRGSSNQRILDVKQSLEQGAPIFYYDDPSI